MAEGIEVGGEIFPVRLEGAAPGEGPVVVVRSWRDHGLQFKAGDGHNRARTEDVLQHVEHTTGGERHPLDVFRTLMNRGLGCHFVGGAREEGELGDGLCVLYQFADPLIITCAHAGFVNGGSVGTEWVNYLFRNPRDPRRWLVPKAGRHREIYEAQLNGRRRKFARMTPHQLGVNRALCDTLSRAMDIPRTVPVGPARVLERGEAEAFRGHMGHYHVSARKSDPGPELMKDLRDHFMGTSVSLV